MIQKQDGSVSRRVFLIAGSGAVAAIASNLRYGTKPVQAKAGSPKAVNIVEFSNSGQREDTVSLPVIVRTASGLPALKVLGTACVIEKGLIGKLIAGVETAPLESST